MVFYHSLISTSNDEERDTTHGVESNEHHSFILVLDSSGFFKRRESPRCFNDPPFTRHIDSPPTSRQLQGYSILSILKLTYKPINIHLIMDSNGKKGFFWLCFA